jgi:hypothetical protein
MYWGIAPGARLSLNFHHHRGRYPCGASFVSERGLLDTRRVNRRLDLIGLTG